MDELLNLNETTTLDESPESFFETPVEQPTGYAAGLPTNCAEGKAPLLFLYDISTSTALNGADEEEQQSLQAIESSLRSNPLAAGKLDIEVLTFGNGVQILQNWTEGSRFQAPQLPEADGDTPLYEALDLTINQLNERRQMYNQLGTSSYVGTIILVTDGAASDPEKKDVVLARLHEMMRRKKVCIIPIGVGRQADMGDLKEVADGGTVLKAADANNFSDAIRFLTDSMSDLVCQTNPGDAGSMLTQMLQAPAPMPEPAPAPNVSDDNCLDMF